MVEGGAVKGQRKVIIPDDATEPREYSLPRGVHVNVHEGERRPLSSIKIGTTPLHAPLENSI